ncbi:hypothetical protein [Aestuariispira ectoiniformans]|uniref:hypothetical protein n=1 Tax=Aestuariispira ectoiniformans TaxID=2775080 RepID=UPI00223C3C00|nr:hypothetical protein [Aestuariispira ectoiniformans]
MNSQTETVDLIRNGLQTLSPMELEELDSIITPRAAELLVKAFGPDMWEILVPLVENDDPKEVQNIEESIRQMMRDPRYWRDRDPSTVRQVSEGFQRLYPGQPQN